MEKKNTMLLTVIAVATLLVAVVGATFAYFSLTVDGGTSSTVVKSQSQNLPTITMEKGKDTFGISVTAEDMAMNSNGPRWAMNTGDETSNESNASTGKNAGDGKLYYWSQNEIKYNLFTIKATNVSTDENDVSTYECPVTITLTAKDDKIDGLTQGDLILYLYSKNGEVLVSDPSSDGPDKTSDLISDWTTSDGSTYLMEESDSSSSHATENGCSGESKKGCYDVYDLFNENKQTKTLYTVVIVKSDESSASGTSVEASMKLVNKSSADQSALAGKEIQITLASQLAQEGCKVIAKEA